VRLGVSFAWCLRGNIFASFEWLPRMLKRWTPSWTSRRRPSGSNVARYKGSEHRRHLGYDRPLGDPYFA
jgi:hypothetical protein